MIGSAFAVSRTMTAAKPAPVKPVSRPAPTPAAAIAAAVARTAAAVQVAAAVQPKLVISAPIVSANLAPNLPLGLGTGVGSSPQMAPPSGVGGVVVPVSIVTQSPSLAETLSSGGRGAELAAVATSSAASLSPPSSASAAAAMSPSARELPGELTQAAPMSDAPVASTFGVHAEAPDWAWIAGGGILAVGLAWYLHKKGVL